MTNLNTAFDVAEKYLDIPKMLDAEGERRRRPERMQHDDVVVMCSETEMCPLSSPAVMKDDHQRLVCLVCSRAHL